MASADSVLLELVKRCGHFGVSVLVSETMRVDCDGIWTSGYFDADEKKLVIGTGVPEKYWLEVLLHEYSHVTQWVENSALWHTVDQHTVTVQDWLDGTRCHNIEKVMAETRELEMDCERRAIRLGKELNIDLDYEGMAQRANAYGHFHNVMLDCRKWFHKERGIYQSPDIWPLFNKTIDSTWKTNRKQRAALLACV